jgi:hypothetical protein
VRALAFAGIAVTVAGSCIACGTEPGDDTLPTDDAANDVINVCLGCEPPPAIEEQHLTPTAMVQALPPRLMFYGDTSTTDGLAPQLVTVRNSTPSTVLIIDAYIANGEHGGAEFFALESPSFEEPLSTHDELAFTVSFASSSEQQDALLVIETTHEGFPQLIVELSGKLFLW